MSETSDRARALFAAARVHGGPTAEDRDRIRAALAVRLATVAATGIAADATAAARAASGASGAGASAGAAAATGSLVTAKAIAAGTLIGAACFVAGFFAGKADSAPAAEAVVRPAVVTVVAPAPARAPAAATTGGGPAPPARQAAPAAGPSPSTPPLSATPAAPPPSVVIALAPKPGSRTPAPSPSAATSPARPSGLLEEVALLRDARAALESDDAAQALARLDNLGARHPDGMLREERLAVRVLALCAGGRKAEARAEADRFLAEMPGSLQAGRVRGSCAYDAAEGGEAAKAPTEPPDPGH